MGGILSLFASGGKLDPAFETEGKIIGTVIGAIGGGVVGSIVSDIMIIGSPELTLYGAIALGALAGFVYLSNGAGLIAQATRFTA